MPKKRPLAELEKQKTHPTISSGNSKPKTPKKNKSKSVKNQITSNCQKSGNLLPLLQQKQSKLSRKEMEKLKRLANTELPGLTPTEKETYKLYWDEFLTPTQISKERGIDLSTIYKHIKTIKKKGFWQQGIYDCQKRGVGMLPLCQYNTFSKHGERLQIKIIDKSDKFLRSISKLKNKTLLMDNNTIEVTSDYIDILSNKEFLGDSAHECDEKSMRYWLNFIKKLESREKILLLKEGYSNIRYSHRGHYADRDNDIARDFNRKNKKLHLYDKEGKLFLLIDKSEGEDHFEYVHSQSSKSDAENFTETFSDIKNNYGSVKEYFLDLKQNFSAENPFRPSELARNVNLLNQNLNNISSHLDQFMSENEKLSKNIAKLIKNTNKYYSEMNKTIYELGASNKNIALGMQSLQQILLYQLKQTSSNFKSKPNYEKSNILSPLDRDINPYM